MSAEVERLKQERFALSQEHRSRAEELHGLEQAVGDAQMKLMRSPDRVRRGIVDKERLLAEQRALKNELDAHLRADELRLRVFVEIEEGVTALNRVQMEIIEYRNQAGEKRRANSERRDEIRAFENQLHAFEREAAHLDRKLQDMKERFDKLAEDRVRERERFEARERELSQQYVAEGVRLTADARRCRPSAWPRVRRRRASSARRTSTRSRLPSLCESANDTTPSSSRSGRCSKRT